MTLSTSLYNSNSPMVSICCSTYNHEKYIEKALAGFLMQKTNFPVEILINDDFSTDNTATIIKEYEKCFPEIIKPIYQTKNQYSLGLKPLSQVLLPRCKGKYIAFCEGDDFWTNENKLQKQVDFLEENPNISMSYTNFFIANEVGEVTKKYLVRKEYQKSQLNHLEVLEYIVPRTLTVVFRRESLQNKVPPEISLVPNGDNFMFALITKTAPAAYLDIVSGCHRLNKNSVYSMKSLFERNKMLFKTLTVLKKYFTDPDEQKAINSQMSRKKFIEASCYLKIRKPGAATLAIISSLKYSRKPYLDKLASILDRKQ